MVEETSCHMLELFSIPGINIERPMRLKGSISSKPITVLINSEAVSNLLNPYIAEQLALPVESIKPMKFTTPSHDHSSKSVTDVTLKIQGYTLNESFLLLDVPGCDLILGAKWLESL
ncbi:hypothetical protein ACFX2J_035659 [Malus domestica]